MRWRRPRTSARTSFSGGERCGRAAVPRVRYGPDAHLARRAAAGEPRSHLARDLFRAHCACGGSDERSRLTRGVVSTEQRDVAAIVHTGAARGVDSTDVARAESYLRRQPSALRLLLPD